jgi:hypothetical protein
MDAPIELTAAVGLRWRGVETKLVPPDLRTSPANTGPRRILILIFSSGDHDLLNKVSFHPRSLP